MPLRHTLSTQLRRFEKEFKTLNRAEISRAAILHNVDLFKSLSPGSSLIAVLKSNAYGHGLEPVAEILKEAAVAYIAVDGYFEALQLRAITHQPILVMGYIHPDNFSRMDCAAFSFVVSDQITVEALGATGKPVKIHLELETGMSRMGVKKADLPSLLSAIGRYSNLILEGVMSHLADADNPADSSFTDIQARKFDEGVRTVLAAGFKPRFIHLAQSAGSTRTSSTCANTLRVGIGLYGISPLDAEDPQQARLAGLRPALRVVSTVTNVLELAPGESVGYGRTFTATRPTRIGVIPFGYYEGLPRALSNSGSVVSGRETLPIAGRVCMNHTLLDLTDTQVQYGDEVEIIGNDPAGRNSILSLCGEHRLFNYGLLIGINQTVRRVIV